MSASPGATELASVTVAVPPTTPAVLVPTMERAVPPSGVAVTVKAPPAGSEPVSRNSEKTIASVRPRTSALFSTGAAASRAAFTLWLGSWASPACSRTALSELAACSTIVPPFSCSVSWTTAMPAVEMSSSPVPTR